MVFVEFRPKNKQEQPAGLVMFGSPVFFLFLLLPIYALVCVQLSTLLPARGDVDVDVDDNNKIIMTIIQPNLFAAPLGACHGQ